MRDQVPPAAPAQPFDPEHMKILMLSRTPVAGVPFLLKDMLNKYTVHECKTLTGGRGYRDGRRWEPPDALLRDVPAASRLIDWASVVMIHNGHVDRTFRRRLAGKRLLCYYHSEPHRVKRDVERAGAPAYVIAQGHALLYGQMPVLPNLVDIHDPLLQPDWDRGWDGTLRMGWAPSNLHSQKDMVRKRCPYSAKGGPETQPVLKRLEGMGVKVEMFQGVPFDRCMQLRKGLHVMLDEVVTGSYHRCTLEACSQGQVAINAANDAVLRLVRQITGAEDVPWVVSSPSQLEGDVLHLLSEPDRLGEMMAASRKWMEEHWDPKTLIERFYIPAFQRAVAV
jgi:hypothetical protein